MERRGEQPVHGNFLPSPASAVSTPSMPSVIHLLRAVAAVRRRLRLQRALEWGTTAVVLAAALAAGAVAAAKVGGISTPEAWVALAACAALPLLAALTAALLPVSSLAAAQLLDRTHDLRSRVASALEFEAVPLAEDRK